MNTPEPATEPRHTTEPPLVGQTIELFRKHLPDVTFPDVSAAILDSEVARLGECQAVVAMAKAKLREAENDLDATRRGLVALAERALAYARIYAHGHPELEQALAKLGPPKPGRTKQKGRTVRRSTPDEKPTQASLPSPPVAAE
jgi:hypothetical protein